jgi:GH25 family lysozyme M1 (1,4-beta-N-acetylmuramidase)
MPSHLGGGDVHTPRRSVTLFGPQPVAVVAACFAVAVVVPALAGNGSQAAGHRSGTGTVWAMTVSGRKIPVSQKFIPTPVHPEKITHPGADSMGTVTAAHAPWGHLGKRAAMRPALSVPQLPGIDVSSYQGNINWGAVAPYIDFSYAKATEGTYYTNPYFYNQYEGPYNHGVIRGAYHFAIPNNSSGKTQANYFISHGGGWSPDGLTLPGALDIEYNPYGSECYGLTHAQMRSWIWDFVNQYASKEHAYPVIYSTTDWWTTCTGNYSGFARYDPLWIANYSASGGGPLPNGWSFYTFWQYSDSGSLPGDQDVFNGYHSRLKKLATAG